MSLQTPPMTTGEYSTLAEVAGAQAALRDLCKPFLHGDFSPECVIVHPDGIPTPEDQLLVHHEHMTIVLEKHHRSRWMCMWSRSILIPSSTRAWSS